jgi:hypothetical protein
MDIKTLKNIVPFLPPEIAVLMRGPTGIGKSHVARSFADILELPFIDVRGSTMDEAKVGGLPDMKAVDEKKVATFVVPSWFKRACEEPCVIMLDELNRSMPTVMQAFFQIVLDRELGNDEDGVPHRLHPETRVLAAINAGNEYDVNEMDPALLRRFWVCDVEPTVGDWVEWAEGAGLDPIGIQFIKAEPAHWRVEPSDVEPGTVCPNPASWHRLLDALVHMGMAPEKLAGNNVPATFYPIAAGFVGTEAAIGFRDFVVNYELQVSAEDILKGKIKAEDVADAPASQITGIIEKLHDHSKENNWKAKEVKAVAAFAEGLGGEFLIQTFTAVQRAGNMKNLLPLNKTIGMKVVDLVNAARATTK